MTKSLHILLAAIILLPSLMVGADDIKDRVLTAHGLDKFNEVEEIRFTFVVERPNARTERHWEWRTTDNVVTYREAKGEEVTMITYDRDELEDATEEVISVDRKFINDSFWLLWPLHASWSEDAKVEQTGDNTIRLSYPSSGGGYSPGDAYVIDLDKEGLATHWAFHKGGAEQPSLENSFEDYVTAGPFLLATMHRNDDGFALSFENISVKLTSEPEWKLGKKP